MFNEKKEKYAMEAMCGLQSLKYVPANPWRKILLIHVPNYQY